VRFVDFLKTTVLLSAGAATLLAVLTVVGAGGNSTVILVAIAWWVLTGLFGLALGRRAEINPPIARLLAAAKATNTLPQQRPAAVLLNRLWPLLLYTLGFGALAFVAPQIPGTAAGLPIILALYWRRQESAVSAIEERDGAQFYVEKTSPLRPIALVRTTGFRTIRPHQLNGAV